MDLTPMNLQVMIPRANDAGQIQHNMNQQSAVQEDFQAIRQKAEDKLKQQQVRTKSEAEDGRIKDDPNKKGGQGQYQPGRKKNPTEEEPEEEKMAVDAVRGQHIDIKF